MSHGMWLWITMGLALLSLLSFALGAVFAVGVFAKG